MLGLGIALVATFAAQHFAGAARAKSATPLAWVATGLVWIDALAIVALLLGLFS